MRFPKASRDWMMRWEDPAIYPWFQRTVTTLHSFTAPRWRRTLLALASAAFLLGVIYYSRQISAPWSEIGWGWLVVSAVVGVPLTIITNAVEFQLSARLVNDKISGPRAVKIAVFSDAANFLPLPGGALVRVQALHRRGHRYRDATLSTTTLGVAWIGTASLITGSTLLVARYPAFGAACIAVGLVILGFAWLLMASQRPRGSRIRFSFAVLGLEVASLSVAGLRAYVTLLALSGTASVPAAILLTFAGVSASAVAIVPAGLGLRELLSAGLFTLLGLPAATGFLASAIDRLLGLSLQAPMALCLAATNRKDVLAESDEMHGR
jgi:uncharacterized membrane protein YbhN (UPF0104 family)